MEVLDIRDLTAKPSNELRVARYAMHMVRAVQYAGLHLQGHLSEDEAQEEYKKAMENFDQIVAGAADRTIAAEEREMAKGSFAVTEMIEKIKNG